MFFERANESIKTEKVPFNELPQSHISHDTSVRTHNDDDICLWTVSGSWPWTTGRKLQSDVAAIENSGYSNRKQVHGWHLTWSFETWM